MQAQVVRPPQSGTNTESWNKIFPSSQLHGKTIMILFTTIYFIELYVSFDKTSPTIHHLIFVSVTESALFVKKLLAVSVSNIAYLRGLFNEGAFGGFCLKLVVNFYLVRFFLLISLHLIPFPFLLSQIAC